MQEIRYRTQVHATDIVHKPMEWCSEQTEHSKKILYTNRFETIYDLSVCINKFVRFYRLERKHTGLVKELKLKTPIDAIKYWFEIKPELFGNKTNDFELNFVNRYKNN